MAAKVYKYQFVSPPPDDVICPLCLDIVEEPHQFTCCGQHICKKCGDKLKQQDTTPQCPMCRHNECILLPDKYFERNTLNKLPIWCSEGCGQEAELGQLKNHLQQCPCVQEDCPYGCGQQYSNETRRATVTSLNYKCSEVKTSKKVSKERRIKNYDLSHKKYSSNSLSDTSYELNTTCKQKMYSNIQYFTALVYEWRGLTI